MKELIRHGSVEQLVLRAVVVLASLLFAALLTGVSGRHWLDFMTMLLPAALGIIAALFPAHLAPLSLQLYILIAWVGINDDVRTVWTLPAAALMLLIHAACALAAVLPIAAPVPPGLWSIWAGRLSALMGVTTVAWMLVRAVSGAAVPFAVLMLLAASAAVTVAALAHNRWVQRL